MKARDSFDAPPPRQPGRVKRVDLFLSIVEVDVPAVIEDGVEITPATTQVQYIDTYQFNRPDMAGGSDEYCSGALRPHLTPTRKGHAKGLLDYALAKANGND